MEEAMPDDLTITREIPPLPRRGDDAHKGEVGRIMVIGGCDGAPTMIGAPALAANAAYRAGAGLVQVMVPDGLRSAVAVQVPCATISALPADPDGMGAAVDAFGADVLAIGPGLGDTLSRELLLDVLERFPGPVVVDADGLNLLARDGGFALTNPDRFVLTPHPGEMRRLLSALGLDLALDRTLPSRRAAIAALIDKLGCNVVLKGFHSLVSDGRRLYINETGNSGMATGGTGDVLTGAIAALLGQGMVPFEAAILGTYLHGLAGDFAAEELGRWSMTATDLLELLPEAFTEYDHATTE